MKLVERGEIVLLFILCATLLLAAGCSAAIIRVSDGSEVGMPELVDSAREARLVVIGEVHTESSSHRDQLAIIEALKNAGMNFAIGMEMFQAEDQPRIDRWLAGAMSEEDFKKVYYANWHVSWKEYRQILLYAKDNKIPVIGLNVSSRIMRDVFARGYKSLPPEELAKIPGIECVVDKTYEEFIRKAMEEHAGMNIPFTRFCEAQLVWDTVMARNSVKYLDGHPGYKLVVLAGSGHSWKRGIPAQVKKISKIPYLVILPEIPGKLDRKTVTTGDADYLMLDPVLQ